MDDPIENVQTNTNRKCAEMVHVKSPNNFWIRLEEYKNDYIEMLAQLQLQYQDAHEDLESLNISDVKLGSTYCSFNHILFEWHRCEILAVNMTDVYICYIDIGQTDLVPIKSIKNLQSHFQIHPPFALHCSLNGIKPHDKGSWSLQVVDEFTKITHKKILTLNIKSKIDNVYHVDLFVKNVNISEHLVKLNYAVQRPADIVSINTNSIIHKIKVESDKEYCVSVPSIVNPFCFYVQISQHLAEFAQFETEMQDYYRNLPTEGQQLVNPQIGELYMAKYTEDQEWYRAKVKEINNETKTFRVFFIDYGNEDIVSHADLRRIEPKFMQHPIMAIKCCLDGIKPPSEGFLESKLSEVADFMYNSLMESVVCVFTGRKIDDYHLVSVNVQGEQLAKILIDNSYASKIENSPLKKIPIARHPRIQNKSHNGDGSKKYLMESLNLELNKIYEVIVTHIETFREFYIKLQETDLIKSSMNNMRYFYEKKINLPQPLFEPSIPCVYYDYDNKDWLRAKIIHIYDDNHCLIRLVDSGRTKYVNRRELREIFDKFLEQQCQGALACLDGLCDFNDEDIDEGILLKFKEIALNKKFIAKVIKVDRMSMSKYTLNLFDESGESVYHVLVDNLENSVLNLSQKFKPIIQSKLEETQISMLETSLNDTVVKPLVEAKKPRICEYYYYEPLKIQSELKYTVNISTYETKNSFFVQINSEFEIFDAKFSDFQQSCELANRIDLDDLAALTDISKLAVGARFYEDNLWYRAKIMTQPLNNMIKVEFVDYGNVQDTKCQDLVYLSSLYAKFPPSTLKIDSIAHIDEIDIADDILQKILLYGDSETEDNKHNWQNAFFRLSPVRNEIIIDDFYALLYRNSILKSDFYLKPALNDPISKLNNELEIKSSDILSVRLCNIEHGLKYIYFNLKSSLERLDKMESLIEPLIKIEQDSIKMNQFFLVKSKKNKFVRCVLLAKKSKKDNIVFYVDYGRREILNSEAQCFLMPPSLYSFGLFGFHCRLTLADNIENVWTREEKEKFYQKIKPGHEYEIKLITRVKEPFIIEFYDKKNQIDFQFNQIISRMTQTKYETQAILNGIKIPNEDYHFLNHTESLDSDIFKIYAQSDGLFENLVEFTEKMIENLKAHVNELKVKTIKKGDVFLSRTRSAKFLANIKNEKIRNFISKYYCRICVEEKKNYLQIFYIDFGFRDIVPFENEILSNDYKMLTIPLQFKIIPQFLLEVKPNKFDYIKKLNNAVKFNDFIDSDLIISNLNDISGLIFKIDFSQAFYSSTEPISQVDLVEKDGKNQNLIDLLIEKTFTNLTNYNFEVSISHLNSVEDFYVQKIKCDSLLKDLQETIQHKIQNKKLQRLKSIETNKLCVSGFEDGCYYRARIIGFGHKVVNSDEIVCDVFYIDYGNTSTVRTSDLYELTPDLMDRFPKNFAINCRIDFNYCPTKEELEFINEFLFEIFETRKFDAKFKNRLSDNKYNEAGFYLIDLFDSATKENVIDMFRVKALKEVQGQLSCVQFNGTMSDSIEEDKAIAESLNDDTVANATNLHESISMTKKEQDKFHQKLSDTWETTALELRNYEKFDDTMPEKEPVKKQLNDTWETTAIDLKNYDQYNETLNQTLINKQDESIDKSELYSTANSSQFDSIDKTISETDNQEDYVLIKDCLISFMHSTTDLYIQEANFDENIQKIQPSIDNCLDPFDLSESNLCIGQFQQDQLFYRCRVLQWFEEGKAEAFCELIDFGNRDYIPIDTITKMSDDLRTMKPLAINCSLNFNLDFESKAYQQLDDLVNLETKFDCRLKKSDLDLFYEHPEQAVSIELSIPKNGIKISKEILEEPCLRDKINEEISKSEFDSYYQIKNEELSPCKTNNFKKREKEEDEDKDDGEPFSGSQNLNFKTSTKLNMAQNNDDNNCYKSSQKASEKPSDIHFYVQEESVNLERTDIHPKNETVSYMEETKWSHNGSLLEDTQNHPKNETVSHMEETKWSHNGSLLEDTQNHPKNETVSHMEETKWSQNASLLEETVNHPVNETVKEFDDTKWSKNENVLEQSEFIDKNKTVCHFEDTKWSENDNTLDDVDNQNETVSQIQESCWSLNETEINYICRSINENNESVWLDDPDQSGFVYKEHIKQTRSNLDATRNEELPEYTQVLTGNVIHVNSIDNFYFQREDADLKLMNMKNLIEKCSKTFDKTPRIGDLCITRYRVDEQLYRAQIIDVKPSQLNLNQSMNSTLKVTDQKVKIRYLDYGNEDYVYVSELFKCDPELKTIEPLALKCELNLDKKLKVLIQKLNEFEKDTTEIVKYFKMLTGRSKVTIKILKLVNVDLKINKVDLFINQENICDLLLNEALACLTVDTKKADCKIKIGVPSSEFFTNVINIKNIEFEKIIKVKNLNVLDKIDELIDSLVNQTVVNEENFIPVQQCLAQVPQDLMEKYKLNNPVSRVFILNHSKSDKYECSFVDFDHQECLPKSNLIASNHFINKIQSAVDRYELNLKNSELISSLSNDQKIQLQETFKNLIYYENNCSSKLRACLIKPKTIRLLDAERENLDINTILELSVNLMCNPFTGRVTHCESDYSQFSVLNELASNEYYKKEMSKIYRSTGLFDFQCDSDDLDVKIGDLCLIDSSSSSNKYVQSCNSIMSLADHSIEDDQVYEFSKEISRGLIMDEIEDKCVVLNLDTGKQLTLKKTRIRILLDDICSVLYKIPFMLIKCKLISQIERNSTTYQQIHKSRYYGNSIKITILDTWNHEFDIKGLHKIVKVNTSDHDSLPTSPSKNLSVFYMLSHVNSLNNFYIHPHDYEKQLKLIQDQIEIEQKKSDKNPPELGKIYAIKEKNNFHRILLMNSYTASSPECESFQAFYIDFGHVKKVYANEIICISEAIQSIAPQAICCKLNGFDKDSNMNQNFLDASESFNDSDQFNDNFYVESFKKILKNEKFQASIYKQWLISRKIINFLPLQSDNLKPIEIVVHLNNQNLTDLLKNLKFKNLKPSTKLDKQFESEFQILNLVSPNEIWICLSNTSNLYTKINQELSQNQLAAFSENQVYSGLPCVKKINNYYKRAVILDSCKIKSELNIRLFLIDYGDIVFSGLEEIFKLPETLYDIEPLAIKISLDLCMPDKHTVDLSTKKLKSLIQDIDTLRFRVLDFRKDYYTVKILNLNVEMGFFLDSLKENLEEKQIIFDQAKLQLNQPLKVLLTNVDTAKHFGIVCSSNYEKRVEFISKFHQWHKENKKSLSSLGGDLLGKPCALSSVQIGKWCRGLVVQSDLTAQMSNVYLVDFCKTLTVTNDRLYKIVQEEFLSEPSYVHRCYLQEEQEQLQRFSKYIDMLKSSGMDPNTNLVSIDNLEIQIEVLEKILTPLHVQSDIKNYQYKIKVLDIKRVKSPLPQSPQSMLNNSAKIKLCHKQVKYSNSFYDETTENILCSTYKENYMINQSESMTMIQSEHKNNDYQSDTFSAITESTRIQTLHDTDNMTLCESRRREETSNWIRDLDENEEEKIFMIYSNLDCDQKSVRVRVLPYGFSPSEFLCQRLELKNSYEKLQTVMNDYYQKIINASKSLERDKINSMRSDFSDSLEITSDLFTNSFNRGDYCAAFLGKSWARCLILDIDLKTAMVECVDDGRKQQINLNKMEKLSDNFKVMPRYCFKCKFSGLDSKKLLSLDLKEIENFEHFLCDPNKELTVDILGVKTEEITGQNVYEINLFMNEQNVFELWQKSERS